MLLNLVLFVLGYCIQCYQCDSNENADLCPQENPFDKEINAMVDCNSFEANVPGQFCVKIYQESPGCMYTLLVKNVFYFITLHSSVSKFTKSE